MKDAYEKNFYGSFSVFHNYANTDHLPLSRPKNLIFSVNNPLKVLFLGSLFQSLHEGAIHDVCKAVRELYGEGYPIQFNLFGQRNPIDFLKSELENKVVIHKGEIDVNERFKIMEEHHLFIIPSSFDKNIANQYRYSIPTKLPELLASGRPTIIYGPSVMESHRFCEDNNCGILISERSIKLLKSKILSIMSSYKKYLDSSIVETRRILPSISQNSKIPEFKDFLLNSCTNDHD